MHRGTALGSPAQRSSPSSCNPTTSPAVQALTDNPDRYFVDARERANCDATSQLLRGTQSGAHVQVCVGTPSITRATS